MRLRAQQKLVGRPFARFLCVVFGFVGIAPFLLALLLGTGAVRSWIANLASGAARGAGISLSTGVKISLWPLGAEASDIRLEASNGGPPFVKAERLRVRPRLFPLLSGELLIAQIDVDSPEVRLVVRSGELVNFALPKSEKPKGPEQKKQSLPFAFETAAVTDARIFLDSEGVKVEAFGVDVDLAVSGERNGEPVFELSARLGGAAIHRERLNTAPLRPMEVDDDVICTIEGRARIEPDSILIHRLDVHGNLDLHSPMGAAPSCGNGESSYERIELALSKVLLRMNHGAAESLTGRVKVRVPLPMVERFTPLTGMGGWVAADIDGAWARGAGRGKGAGDLGDVEMGGRVTGHGVTLERFALASDLESDIQLHGGLLVSHKTKVGIADGEVTLSESTVDLRDLKNPTLRGTRLDLANINFTSLMRDLNVHPHSYVGWDVREGHVASLSGTLVPLKLEGDLVANTFDFGIYDSPADAHPTGKLIGVSEAALVSHVSVREDKLDFSSAHVTTPHSFLGGGFCSIGFHNTIQVDVEEARVSIDEVSPIGHVAMGGDAEGEVHVKGAMSSPDLIGTIRSIRGFGIGGIPFGDIAKADVHLDVRIPALEVSGIDAKYRSSGYSVPTAKVQFLGAGGVIVDAVGESRALELKDLLKMFALDEDPRFDGLSATAETRANVHVALGGPEDTCGGGFLTVNARSHLRNIDLMDERFDSGDMDTDLRWYDRERGISGAELRVRSFTLSKERQEKGAAAPKGTILGSAQIERGGALSGNVMLQGVQLSQVTMFKELTKPMAGTVSGLARISGSLDEFSATAGITASIDLSLDGMRIHDVPFEESRLHVEMSERGSRPRRAARLTGCKAPFSLPFDKVAYKADTSSHGDWTVSGDLFGRSIHLDQVVMSRARNPVVTGHVSFRGTDLGALARVASRASGSARDPFEGVKGALSGEAFLDHLQYTPDETKELHLEPARSKMRFAITGLFGTRGSQRLRVIAPKESITFDADTLTVPPLDVAMETPEGFAGTFHVGGTVTHPTGEAALLVNAKLDPIDLSVLPKLSSNVTQAKGTVSAEFSLRGTRRAPVLSGALRLRADSMSLKDMHGLPSSLTDATLDVVAERGEIKTTGRATMGSGTLALDAATEPSGFAIGVTTGKLRAKNIRAVPMSGAAAAFDADLDLRYDPSPQSQKAPLPEIRGSVTLTSFDYTRAMDFGAELASVGRAKRTEVAQKVVSEDSMKFDLRVKSNAPLHVHNNLVDVQLGVDGEALHVSGTDQRFGMTGEVKAIQGGRFHFQSRDYDIQRGVIRFDDPTRIAPTVDLLATTEYRRFTDSTSSSGTSVAGAGTGGGNSRGGALWHISLHAFGDPDNLRVEMSSDPALSQEDIFLLLLMGVTRAELDQLQTSSAGEGLALNLLSAATGADQAIKKVIPVIDDFRFGSDYSPHTGKTEPQITIGKRLTEALRASVTAGITDDREVRALIEWQLNRKLSTQLTYDNIYDLSTSGLGNTGIDLKYSIEFR